MTQPKLITKMTQHYGNTVYNISVYDSPDCGYTYEDRLLQLIRHEAEKRDDEAFNTSTASKQEQEND